MAPKHIPEARNRRVNSWKEIAGFFGRDERTVKRWEKERGLPVHRIPGGSRGSVFAFEAELAAWLDDRRHTDAEYSSERGGTQESELGVTGPLSAETAASPRNGFRRFADLGGVVLVLIVAVGLLGGLRYSRVAAKSHFAPKSNPSSATAARREAEDLYLQGRVCWNERTPAGLTQSVDYFTRATQRDPSYALGYAGLADAYNLLREYTSTPGSEAFPLALAAARKAVELDDSLPEGHRALAFVTFNWNWDFVTADREYRRAIALRPNDAQSHHWYATMLMELARHPQDVEEIERARELDPSSKAIASDRGLILYSAGRLEEGFAALKALEKVEPDFSSPHFYLSMMYFEQKQYPQSFAETRILDRIAGVDLADVNRNEKQFEKGGEAALLQGLVAQRLDDFENGRGDAFAVAVAYANLGRTKESLEYLDRAFERHEYVLISVRNNPAFRKFAGVPEFEDLLKRLGFGPAGTT